MNVISVLTAGNDRSAVALDTRIVRHKRVHFVCVMDGVNGINMVHDSDPNAAKACFVHIKSGGQRVFFEPHLKKDPYDPCFRGLYAHILINIAPCNT